MVTSWISKVTTPRQPNLLTEPDTDGECLGVQPGVKELGHLQQGAERLPGVHYLTAAPALLGGGQVTLTNNQFWQLFITQNRHVS